MHHTLRPAVAMIELIFALVIMGIVLMSAPQLISTAAQSSYVAIQQESISEAAAQNNMILGYHWDEQDANESFLDPILTVTDGDDELDPVASTGRRKGTPLLSRRTFVRKDGKYNLPASAKLGPEAGETFEDDIDDFNGTSTHLTLSGTDKAGLAETTTVAINNTVIYLGDKTDYAANTVSYSPMPATPGKTTNIKAVGVSVSSTSSAEELQKLVVLWSMSCNIGGYELEKRPF